MRFGGRRGVMRFRATARTTSGLRETMHEQRAALPLTGKLLPGSQVASDTRQVEQRVARFNIGAPTERYSCGATEK